MTRTPNIKMGWLMFGVLLVALSACDRLGPAPEDLDITPTATSVPTATPTPTPEVDATEEPESLSELEQRLDDIRTEVPDTISAGSIIWQRDRNREEEELPNVDNGKGFEIFYTEQGGGVASISFAVFESPEDALAHYEFINSIRSVLDTGESNDTLPQPNKLGAGLYGSVGIFVVDEYFAEASIEAFSSTAGSPLVPLTQRTHEILLEGITGYEVPDTATARIEAIIEVIPDELTANDMTWFREGRNPQVLEDAYEEGIAVRTQYTAEDSTQATVIFGAFNTESDVVEAYESALDAPRTSELRLRLTGGSALEGLPEPNQYASEQLIGESIIVQVVPNYLLDVQIFTEETKDHLPAFTESALDILQDGIDAYEQESAGEEDSDA